MSEYGAYGLNMPMAFDPVRVSLLDRGVVYAVAHVRGGSALSRTWSDDGEVLGKTNTFNDPFACADSLVKAKYCARERLAIEGGLLVAAALDLRPALCAAAVLKVPYTTVLSMYARVKGHALTEPPRLVVGLLDDWQVVARPGRSKWRRPAERSARAYPP